MQQQKSTFSIDNIINGACDAHNEDAPHKSKEKPSMSMASPLKKVKTSSASSSCSSTSSTSGHKKQARAKTPPGLENLPIPPVAVYNVPTNPTVTAAANKSNQISTSSAQSSLIHDNWHAAAAAAALFGAPFPGAPFSMPSQMASFIQAAASANESGRSNSSSSSSQFLNRYQPYMNQLAMVANLSQNNATSSPSTQNSKFFGKA